MKRLLALALGLLLALALVVPVSAAKTTATITLDDSTPAFGQSVTYTIETNADHWHLWVECFQDDFVYWAGGIFHTSSPISETHPLDSDLWSGGAANCTAAVRVSRANGYRVIEQVAFHVDP